MTRPASHRIIATDSAPPAIGAYSQAVQAGDSVYLSGQIPLDPDSGALVEGDAKAQITRVFDNLEAVAKAAGASLGHAVKINVYLTDMGDFEVVSRVMEQTLAKPYPARAVVGVAALPKGARVEADAVLALG